MNTLASQLKQKSKSINLERLKKAAKTKLAERTKAAYIAENERTQKERSKEKEKQRLSEQKQLIKWLVPGLLSGWNNEDQIQYKPCSDDERRTAKKYLGYIYSNDSLKRLNRELEKLEINIRVFQNRIANLSGYAENRLPSLVFDFESLLVSYSSQDFLFSNLWRKDFERKALQFEKSALASFTVKTNNERASALNEIAMIDFDSDILQVKKLSKTLRPRIDTFLSRYQSLVSSPASFFILLPRGDKFSGLSYIELTARREYQLAVAKYVLNEMKIHYEIFPPDVIGKFIAAFRVASGEDLFSALLQHITDPELESKFTGYIRLMDANRNNHKKTRLPSIEGKDVNDILNLIFTSVEKIYSSLSVLKIEDLEINYGQVCYSPSVRIDDLFETFLFPEIDRLEYDIQWFRSSAGQKFKSEFTKYLNELAEAGKYSVKLKIFSEDDQLLIEFPSGKEIVCDVDWNSFEHLMNLLEFEITETTSTGVVKLKWA